jgi:two-component system, chemotaxis family, response regulator Rcp1
LSPQRPLDILVIESNPADSYLIVEGLKQVGPTEGVRVLDDSQEALNQLESGPRPDLILLDLHLEPKSGFEVLIEIRSNPALESVPVIVVSGSDDAETIRRAYQLGANCYIHKPNTLDEFLRFMKTFYQFWGTVATLPSLPPPAG